MSNNNPSLRLRLALATGILASAAISTTGIYFGVSAAVDAVPDTAKTATKTFLCDAFSIPCQTPPATKETLTSLDTPIGIPRSYIIEGARDEVRTRGPIVIDCDISLAHSEAMQRRDLSKCESIQDSQEFLKRRSMIDLHVTFN